MTSSELDELAASIWRGEHGPGALVVMRQERGAPRFARIVNLPDAKHPARLEEFPVVYQKPPELLMVSGEKGARHYNLITHLLSATHWRLNGRWRPELGEVATMATEAEKEELFLRLQKRRYCFPLREWLGLFGEELMKKVMSVGESFPADDRSFMLLPSGRWARLRFEALDVEELELSI